MTEEDWHGMLSTQMPPKRVTSALFLPVSTYFTTYTLGLDIHERMNGESTTSVLSTGDITQNSFRVHSW